MKNKTFCIICADPYCDQCRTDFMCPMCKIREEEETNEQDIITRLMPITDVLRRCLLPEDMNAVLAMTDDWKNGRIMDVDRRLAYLSLKLKDTTMKYLKQIEDVLCDPEYEVDQNLLEDDVYRPGMRYVNANFIVK
jgi:hypothetical protein